MQLLPETAKGIALRTGGTAFRVDDLYDPEINIRYGSWYLRHLFDKYDDERTRARRLQRRPGERRRLARPRGRDRLSRDPRIRRARATVQAGLREAYPDELGL